RRDAQRAGARAVGVAQRADPAHALRRVPDVRREPLSAPTRPCDGRTVTSASMESGEATLVASSRGLRRRDVLAVVSCVAAALWVNRYALGAFFSSPDDLVHLQQAAGLRPTLATPFRFVSQVVYFRTMWTLFGPQPAVYHL